MKSEKQNRSARKRRKKQREKPETSHARREKQKRKNRSQKKTVVVKVDTDANSKPGLSVSRLRRKYEHPDGGHRIVISVAPPETTSAKTTIGDAGDRNHIFAYSLEIAKVIDARLQSSTKQDAREKSKKITRSSICQRTDRTQGHEHKMKA